MLAGLEDAGTGLSALHYLIVYGRLGLFVQSDARPASRDERMAQATDVQLLAIAAGAVSKPGSSSILDTGRLLVVDGAYSARRWVFTGRPGDGGLDGLEGASQWLRHRLASSAPDER